MKKLPILLVLIVNLLTFICCSRDPIENRLKAAISRSSNVITKYKQIHDQHFSQYPGYFTFIEPIFGAYENETVQLKTAFEHWQTTNKSDPIEHLMHWLPGMVFDTDEEDLSKAFVRMTVSRLTEQAKSILSELDRITFLVTSPHPATESITSLHNSSLAIFRKLREAIIKLNYTLTLTNPTKNVFEDFFEVLEEHMKISEMLTKLVDLEAQFGRYIWQLKEKKVQKVDKAELEMENQLLQYFKFTVEKAIKAANKTFRETVNDKEKMKEFKKYQRENGLRFQRIVV